MQGGGGGDLSPRSYGNKVSDGFVYKRVPHITLRSIANNTAIDTIWNDWQEELEAKRTTLNQAAGSDFKEEWQIPREADASWSQSAKDALAGWWKARIARQNAIDAAIDRNADIEYLHDQPYTQKGVVRVTGPFTVESISPHRIIPPDLDDESLRASMGDESSGRPKSETANEAKFHEVVTEHLRRHGVQNGKKKERLEFTALDPYNSPKASESGSYIHLHGQYLEKDKPKRVAICIGPEFGSVSRTLFNHAAREAGDYFDLLIILGFAFENWADDKLINTGRLRVICARMNNDLHMADRLKNTKSGNLFVAFGEPDIDLRGLKDGRYEVELRGIDIYDPTTGNVNPYSPDEIACWFIDTDYNGEAFFVRHAYFLKGGGGSDPYGALKKTLQAEITPEAWETMHQTTSRPFPKPETGRIAVKAINHLGDEVLRVFEIK